MSLFTSQVVLDGVQASLFLHRTDRINNQRNVILEEKNVRFGLAMCKLQALK